MDNTAEKNKMRTSDLGPTRIEILTKKSHNDNLLTKLESSKVMKSTKKKGTQ